MLTKLNFRPGINKEWSDYSNEGGWDDCDKVRFRKGRPEKIGGWSKAISTALTGVCRSLHIWSNLAQSVLTAMGTHLKYFLEEGGTLYDITPVRRSVTLGTDPLTSDAAASGVITVSDTGHGARLGDYVTISGATAFDGLTTGDLNQEHTITEIVGANSYKVDTGGSASAGSVSGGGSSVDAEYQASVGLDTFVPGNGWGAGEWSETGRAWGEASTSVAGGEQIRIWSQDNYGEDLVLLPRGYAPYYWDATTGSNTRGVLLSTVSGASDTPTVGNWILVADNTRQVVIYGCNELGGSTLDPMLIRWSDEEDPANFTPTVTNQSGFFRLSTGSSIISAMKARQETLVWTDSAVYSQRYVGLEFVFGFDLLTQNVSIIGPNAAIIVDSVVYWMDRGNFYRYTGRVELLPCSVLDYIFSDFNYDQAWKAYAGRNSEFGEIIWHYPSAGSSENDRYVVFNYKENIWYIGTMGRTAWLENRLRNKPVATDASGYLYNQENGTSADGSSMNAYIESADMDIEDGDRFWFIRRVIPDFEMTASSMPDITINARDYNGDTAQNRATVSITTTTQQKHVRVRARQIRVRVESDGISDSWRLGDMRLDVRQSGKR